MLRQGKLLTIFRCLDCTFCKEAPATKEHYSHKVCIAGSCPTKIDNPTAGVLNCCPLADSTKQLSTLESIDEKLITTTAELKLALFQEHKLDGNGTIWSYVYEGMVFEMNCQNKTNSGGWTPGLLRQLRNRFEALLVQEKAI